MTMEENKNASEFEKYLLSLGYVRHVFKFAKSIKEDNKLVPADRYLLSTMSDICYVYCKDGLQNITWGLSEAHKPPTLIFPRPKMAIVNELGYVKKVDNDDYMNICLRKYSPAQILNAIHRNLCLCVEEKNSI